MIEEAFTGSSSRINDNGTGEEARFEGESTKILTVVHHPAVPATGGLVICSPLMAELTGNQRRERQLANSLAARGLAVLRFHYRGEGNSDDLDGDISLDSMLQDAAWITTQFKKALGLTSVSFFGTRLGAIVAAAMAARLNAPLVMWEPVTDVQGYFRELDLVRKVSRVASQSGEAGAQPSLVDAVEAGSNVDVLGYSVTPALYESCKHFPILSAVQGAGPVLLVWLGRERPRQNAFVGELQAELGGQVESILLGGDPAWWLMTVEEERELGSLNPEELIGRTTDWVVDAVGIRGAAVGRQ